MATWPPVSSGENVPIACDLQVFEDGTQVRVRESKTFMVFDVVETPQPRPFPTESLWSWFKQFCNNQGGWVAEADCEEVDADDEVVIRLKSMSKSKADQSCLVFSSDDTKHHIRFTVDAKKLTGNHKEVHSPAFEVRFGLIWVNFIIMIFPTVTNDRKGGASFRAATGHGKVQLKCEVARPNSKKPGELKGSSAELQDVRWQVGISNATQNRENVEMRGPVRFSFAQKNVVSRLENDRGWDFRTAVDPSSQKFVICLEIMRD